MDKTRPLIELVDICKIYKISLKQLLNLSGNLWTRLKTLFIQAKTPLIHNFNLKIYPNEKIALIGNNGAGKSTISNIICGYQKPSSGHIIHNYTYKNHPKERISIQFQSGSFPANFYVYDVLNLAKMLTADLEFQHHSLYQLLDIDRIYHKRVRSLSGGEKQRLILFTSLISDPLLLILDEYSNNLDLKSKQEVGNYLDKFFKTNSLAVIMISHDADQIYRFATKIYLMENGKIIEEINNVKAKFASANQLKKYIIEHS